MQNEKEKFKKNFIKRLISFSIKILKLGEKMRSKRTLKEAFPEFAEESEKLLGEVNEISKIIGSSVLALKGKKNL